MKKPTIILISIIVILMGSIFVFSYIKDGTSDNNKDIKIPMTDNVLPGEVREIDENKSTFFHPQYKFSLDFPSDMKNTNFREGAGEQILFQGDSGKKWFQIFITSWDEGDNLSVSRIKQDLPNLLIENPQKVILGPKQKSGIGPRAIIFFSEQDGLGETREVWFVLEGYLYQITTFKKLDTFLAEVLSTLVFN